LLNDSRRGGQESNKRRIEPYDSIRIVAVQFTFDPEKASESIRYLCALKVPGLSKYKLAKLIVLADKHHLVRFGRTITGDQICAMEHGPVPSSTLDLLNEVLSGELHSEAAISLSNYIEIDRRFQYPHFAPRLPFKAYALSDSDLKSLNSVAHDHGNKSFFELKTLTHELPGYKKAWNGRVSNAPQMAYEDLFEEDEEALAGAYEEMLETDSLRKKFGSAGF
jgi:uncharacterized phage-associated protein